jgi:hypothetical protein
MSFIEIEPVRAIKIGGKSYHSAHQAALAYADSATHQLIFLMYKRCSHSRPPNCGMAYMNRRKSTMERFYRRAHPIFTKYFKGG